MIGRIIDMDNSEAFLNLDNGTTVGISKFSLPKNTKIGDTINVNPNLTCLCNHSMNSFTNLK
ncbi:hypothetical protein [Clostridium rectalis]|uniref:hypothetical protein n=1 Tax=Clostridium rectalis TaxID=2040295 RepID=UPI000F63709D|nr:hypothetical protein [Clostridium rectalis]